MLRVVIMHDNGKEEVFEADGVKILHDVPQAAAYFEGEEPPKVENQPKSDILIFTKDGKVLNTVHVADTKEVNVLPILQK